MMRKYFLVILIMALSWTMPTKAHGFARYTFLFYGVPYSFEYPTGWATDESFGLVTVANSASALANFSLKPTGDDIGIWVAPVEFLYFIWEISQTTDSIDEMGKIIGRYASDPRNHAWEFESPQALTLLHHRPAVIVSGFDPKTKDIATYIVVEYDKRFLLFFGHGTADTLQSLNRLVTHAANSLKIGSEFALEKASVRQTTFVNLQTVFALCIENGFIYAIENCQNCSPSLVKLSLDGKIIDRVTGNNFAGINSIAVNKDGTLWAARSLGVGKYDIVLLSAEGKVLESLNVDTQFLPLIRVGSDGNLYIVITRQIVPLATQRLDEVQRDETEDWVQVRDSTGKLLKEFLIKKEEYTLKYGTDGVSFDSEGSIYFVFSRTNKGIVIYRPTGQLVKEGFARGKVMFQNVSAFDIMPNESIFLSTFGDFVNRTATITHLNNQGQLLGVFSAQDLGIKEGYLPMGFRATTDGQVVIVALDSTKGIQIIKMTPSEEF